MLATRSRIDRGWWVALWLVVLVGTASAEPEWAKGVDKARKARAQELLERGNDEFARERYKDALATYEEALAAWAHPAIRFNVVRVLVALDRPLDAYEQLEQALAFGREPFEDTIYTEALNYQRLLKGQISTIQLACEQPGVTLELDGKSLVRCPGSRAIRVLPGTHRLHAAGTGLEPESRDVVAEPGKTMPLAIRLAPRVQERVARARRWPAWQPWSIVAAGVALTGVGVTFNVLARDARDELDTGVARDCGAAGCDAETYRTLGYAALEDRVSSRNRISLVTLAIGGGTLVAGGVLVLLNRPMLRRVSESAAVVVTGDEVGVALGGRF